MAKFIGLILLYVLSAVIGIALLILIICALISMIRTSDEIKKIRIVLEKSLLKDEEADEVQELYDED
ncbi:MAG: hypothetical protein IK055_04735 [Lachnospiraceae bacterium]|nr:hypothetical protein [Lachnospiraceae bacterium]